MAEKLFIGPLTYDDIVRLVTDRVTESENLEYKSSIKTGEDIARTICAMSNTTGGRIIIGITAKDRGPTELNGWVPIKNLDSSITQHIREKTKPPTAIGRISVYDIPIPGEPSNFITVCEIPRAHDAVWYRINGVDTLFLRNASSTLPAKEREEFLGLILSKNNEVHELAQVEMNNDNFDGAERIYDGILVTYSRDARAWLGKFECSVQRYDAGKAIDCLRKAAVYDPGIAKREAFVAILDLKQLYYEFTTRKHAAINPGTGEIIRVKSELTHEVRRGIEKLPRTMDAIVNAYGDLFPETVECHLARYASHVVQGRIVSAVAELGKANGTTPETTEMQAILKGCEAEARALSRKQQFVSLALAIVLAAWTAYFIAFSLLGLLDSAAQSWIQAIVALLILTLPIGTSVFIWILIRNYLNLRAEARKHFSTHMI